jgi:type II secretory pathway pseudopilin PulG
MRRSFQIIGAVAATFATTAVGAMADTGSADAAMGAKSEYAAALKAAAAQNVHFVSKAIEQGIALEVIGDAGKNSGAQVIEVKRGSTTENLAVVLIGSTGYLRGNVSALEKVLGLTTAQSKTYTNKWLSFPTSNTALAELVSGLRNSEVASELQMTGPYTLGGTKKIGGQTTLAINGTASTSTGSKVPIVLYVNATGTPRPVEEDTNPKAKSADIEGKVTFSKWGENTHPKAPPSSIPLVPLLPAG